LLGAANGRALRGTLSRWSDPVRRAFTRPLGNVQVPREGNAVVRGPGESARGAQAVAYGLRMRSLAPTDGQPDRLRRGLVAITLLAALAVAAPAHAAPDPVPSVADLVVSPAETTSATSLTVTWSVPPGLADGTSARWDLCPVGAPPASDGGHGCGTARSSDGPTTTAVPTPDEGRFDLTVWLENAEGDQGPPSQPRRIVIDRTAPGGPTDVRWGNGPFRIVGPGDYRLGDSVVRWTPPTDDGAPIARVHWKFCREWSSRWPGFPEQCLTGSRDPSPFLLDESPIPTGPPPHYCVGYFATVLLWLEDTAGNVDLDPANAGGTGLGANPSCPPPFMPPPPHDGPLVTPRAVTNLTVGRRVATTGKGTKRRQRVTLTATMKPGTASGVVRIRATGKHGKRQLTRTRTLQLSQGRASFTLTVPTGFRRLSVRADYAGSATHAPSSRTSTVRIPRR